MSQSNLITCESLTDLAARTADFIVAAGKAAIAERGRFLLVLTGGKTPENAYALLAQEERAVAVEWSKVFVFIGDDRMVPAGDARSNFGMAKRTLLDHVPIPPEHVFPVPTVGNSPAEAAAKYEADLKRFFAAEPSPAPPRFDLIHLGLGDDGHTASLFPHAKALDVDDAWVTSSPPGTLPPPVDRVTLTYPVLNAARQVLFVAAGENKAPALRDILGGKANRADRPAVGVKPENGSVTWIIDSSAAKAL